ncbi:hypothetical protein HAX54_050021, partial [Datura stramonium]|nr:hypothetical protein [Datura stramonium]
ETRAKEIDDEEVNLPKLVVADKTIVINMDLEETEKHPVVAKEDVCEKEKEKEMPKVMSQIPSPPPPFPQRLKKKTEDGKFC